MASHLCAWLSVPDRQFYFSILPGVIRPKRVAGRSDCLQHGMDCKVLKGSPGVIKGLWSFVGFEEQNSRSPKCVFAFSLPTSFSCSLNSEACSYTQRKLLHFVTFNWFAYLWGNWYFGTIQLCHHYHLSMGLICLVAAEKPWCVCLAQAWQIHRLNSSLQVTEIRRAPICRWGRYSSQHAQLCLFAWVLVFHQRFWNTSACCLLLVMFLFCTVREGKDMAGMESTSAHSYWQGNCSPCYLSQSSGIFSHCKSRDTVGCPCELGKR